MCTPLPDLNVRYQLMNEFLALFLCKIKKKDECFCEEETNQTDLELCRTSTHCCSFPTNSKFVILPPPVSFTLLPHSSSTLSLPAHPPLSAQPHRHLPP